MVRRGTLTPVSSGRPRRPEVLALEGVRVEAAPVDLDPEELLQADVADPDVAPEVIQQRELARLVRRLEHRHVEPEGIRESIREGRIEVATGVENSDAHRALPRLDHELLGTGVQPPAA